MATQLGPQWHVDPVQGRSGRLGTREGPIFARSRGGSRTVVSCRAIQFGMRRRVVQDGHLGDVASHVVVVGHGSGSSQINGNLGGCRRVDPSDGAVSRLVGMDGIYYSSEFVDHATLASASLGGVRSRNHWWTGIVACLGATTLEKIDANLEYRLLGSSRESTRSILRTFNAVEYRRGGGRSEKQYEQSCQADDHYRETTGA